MPVCNWCLEPLGNSHPLRRWCSKRCRQTAWRIRRLRHGATPALEPLALAYADPPFPGMARKLYGSEEVDHKELIQGTLSAFDGWALSTSAQALPYVLSICPENVRICTWVKPIGVSTRTMGLHNSWEPLIVCGGRVRRPGVRDWLRAQPARGGGQLPGRKPLAFCAWLFDCLGMLPGDYFCDLFPGTGIVMRAWRQLANQRSANLVSAQTNTRTRGGSRETA